MRSPVIFRQLVVYLVLQVGLCISTLLGMCAKFLLCCYFGLFVLMLFPFVSFFVLLYVILLALIHVRDFDCSFASVCCDRIVLYVSIN